MCYEKRETGSEHRSLLRMTRVLCSAIIIAVVLSLAYCNPASAGSVPANAEKYLPLLLEVRRDVGPFAESVAGWEAAQVQKETCITPRHHKCWNPMAELKTAREYGFGFPQITIAYKEDGKTERFNVFKELKALDPVLRTWQWEDRFNPRMQFRALLVKNKIGYKTVSGAKTDVDHLAFSLAGYNGGVAGVLSDRALCKATPACDPARWFGHVERTSNKSRTPWKGYGKSAFDINREYPRDIIYTLRPQYEHFFMGK